MLLLQKASASVPGQKDLQQYFVMIYPIQMNHNLNVQAPRVLFNNKNYIKEKDLKYFTSEKVYVPCARCT
jgi:hypothetical protein